MGKKYKHLSLNDRIKIETLLNAKHSVIYIANYLGVHRSTVYREINKGIYIHRNSDYTEEPRYSSDLGQQKHNWNMQALGKSLKIGNDIKLAEYLENKIVNDKYSPDAAIISAKKSNICFKVTISTRTLYRYIDAGLFLNLTNKDLPVKGKRKRRNKKVKVQKRASKGISIEKRPKEIDTRHTFGHWEMDTVKGSRGKTKSCLLVLTERKTRQELIFKMNDQKSDSVVKQLDLLEQKWGELFYKVFRSITVDNGVEFSNFNEMEKSKVYPNQNRTFIFYCHPYSSWERSSNENQNKLVRRHIPKGENIDNKQDEEIAYIEKWINTYPRKLFDYKTSEQLFNEEIEKISA